MRIFNDVYRIRIPIPIPALKHLNVYLIDSGDGFYLIDTGTPNVEAFNSLIESIKALNFDPRNLEAVIVTHMHIDHIGNAARLQREYGVDVYMNAKEYSFAEYFVVNLDKSARDLKKLLTPHGVPEEKIDMIIKKHPALSKKNFYELLVDIKGFHDGDTIKLGDLKLLAVETPGHSPHHTCFLYKDKKILFSGDHILSDITPNVMMPIFGEDSLSNYLKSLEKVSKLDVEKYLPAHRDPSVPLGERVFQLKKHHYYRLIEVLEIVNGEEKNIFEIASKMTWDIKIPWSKFPPAQLFFAIGEALAHVYYLKFRGFLEEIERNNSILYKLVTDLEDAKKGLKREIFGDESGK